MPLDNAIIAWLGLMSSFFVFEARTATVRRLAALATGGASLFRVPFVGGASFVGYFPALATGGAGLFRVPFVGGTLFVRSLSAFASRFTAGHFVLVS
jgi:hypothetical protein